MTRYDFDQLPDRRSSESEKWHAYDAGVLPMWVADMDFISPEPVIRALRQRVKHGIYGYPQEPYELRQLLVDRLHKLRNWQITPEDVILLPGVITGLNLSCHAIAAPGGAVLVQTPVYTPILRAAKTTTIAGQEMELTRCANGSYCIDWQAFEASFTSQTRLLVLCNPHNPIGKVFLADELERMAETSLRRGVVICSDEIHCDLVYRDHRHIPIASLAPEIAQNTITLMAPSKTFNVAGLKCSFAIIQNPELRKRFLSARKGLVSGVNLMGLVAAQAAYRDAQEWLDQLLAYLEANRDFLYDYVKNELPGIQMGLPEGTYLAWLDCRQAGIQEHPAQFFLEKARVAFVDGNTFGRGGEGFIRLNFGCPRSMLLEALERLKKSLEVTRRV